MATASSRVVRRASTTCISDDLATMQTASVWASTRWRRVSSSSARTPARRVEPKATRVARSRCSSFGARAKNSASFGLAPGHPPSMNVTPRWSSCSATRSLSSTVSDRPSCWDPSRRVVSKTSTASGRAGRAKSWPPRTSSGGWSWSGSRSCSAHRRPRTWASWPAVSGWEWAGPPPWRWACPWLWACVPPALAEEKESSLRVGPSLDIVQPVPVLLDLAAHGGEVRLLDLLGDGTGLARPHLTIVDGPDRHHLGGRSGEEGLVGRVEVGPDELLVVDLQALVAGDPLDRLLGDSRQGPRVGARRGEQPAVADDEDVLARALADEAILLAPDGNVSECTG